MSTYTAVQREAIIKYAKDNDFGTDLVADFIDLMDDPKRNNKEKELFSLVEDFIDEAESELSNMMCEACNGSGEGCADGTRCTVCGGRGG